MPKNTMNFIATSAILLTIMLFAASPALAFKRSLRCQIIRDAILFAPENLQEYLVNNFEAVHKGIHHVDMHDKRNSVLNPYDAEDIYKSLIDSINKGKLCSYNTAHRFGVLAGYLAESVSPDEHRKLRDLVPGQVLYDGQHHAGEIHNSLSRIIRNYRNPYLGQQRREVTDFLYVVAVNEIVDHWCSAWQEAAQDIGELRHAGYDIQRVRQADLLRGVNLKLPG